MSTTITEPRLLDARGPVPASVLANYDDLGECRKVAEARVRAFRLREPTRVIDSHARDRYAVEGDVLVIGASSVEVVSREYYDTWYEPAAALEPSQPDGGGPANDRDVIAALRLALAAAADDRAARRAVSLILDRAAPTNGSRTEPVAVLVDVIKSSQDLRFEMTDGPTR